MTLVQSLDSEVEQFMRNWINKNEVRNNSIILIMSDHGNRPARLHIKSLVGLFDWKNPFVYMLLPPWIKQKYPERVRALSINAKERVTTNLDLYNTFVHLMLQFEKDDVRNNRSQTLFNIIPKSRTCAEMGFKDMYLCGCQEVLPLDPR